MKKKNKINIDVLLENLLLAAGPKKKVNIKEMIKKKKEIFKKFKGEEYGKEK